MRKSFVTRIAELLSTDDTWKCD